MSLISLVKSDSMNGLVAIGLIGMMVIVIGLIIFLEVWSAPDPDSFLE